MKLGFRSFFSCVAVATLTVACAGPNRSVKRIGTDTTTDLSGNWNDTDARLTSEALIKQCFAAPWLKRFVDDEGREPRVRVSTQVVNKTDEHIDAQVFIKNIEKAMINSGQVEVLSQEGGELDAVNRAQDYAVGGRVDEGASVGNQLGEDFVVTAYMASIVDQVDGKRAKFYKITFELHDVTKGKKVWIGDHEIKKFITQARASW